MKHKIFCFNNGGSDEWYEAIAIGDDGHIVGAHICSHPAYMKHDLGIESTWKHDQYNKQYGEGNWELVWEDDPSKLKHLFELNAKRRGLICF